MRRKAESKEEPQKGAAPSSKKPFHLEFKNTSQKIAWMAFEQHDILFLLGPAGCGKSHLAVAFAISELLSKKKKKIMLTRPIVEAGEKLGYLPGPQPLDAKILTPNGWTTMGDLKLGDFIIGRDGKSARVLRILPQGKKMVYKVSTTENTSTEACEDHIWLTKTFEEKKRNKKGNIRTTKEIMSSLVNKNNKFNHYLPRNEAVEFNKKELPIPPYTFGALLGDGCFSNSISLIATDWDNEILLRANKELSSLGCEVVRMKNQIVYNIRSSNLISKKPARKVLISNLQNGTNTEYDSIAIACKKISINKATLVHRCKKNLVIKNFKYEFLPLENRWANPIKNIIDKLGLLGKKAETKFIPELYKYSSTEDRINLLRGLMDTDGTVKKNGEASFSTTSPCLAQDVVELVQSLGGRAVLRKREKRLEIKKIKGRTIIPKYESYEFTISLPEAFNPFYLNRKAKNFKCNYIHDIGIKSIETVCEKEVQCILVDNDEHLYITDQYIVTHNTFEEKINPYLMPVFDVMDRMVGKESAERERVNKALEIAPMAYLRGRSVTLDTNLITPTGFKKMGDIKIGDLVCGSDGQKTKVVGVYPQGEISVYRVRFTDGTFVDCSADHLWSTLNLNEKRHKKDYSVKSTLEIKNTLKNTFDKKNHRLPISQAVNFVESKIPIDPYLLGVLLGDGHIGKHVVKFTSADEEIISEVSKRIDESLLVKKAFRKYDYNIVTKNIRNKLLQDLRELNLSGKTAINKFIPDIYKFNSTEVRLEILKGLLDSDGWVGLQKTGVARIQFTSCSKQLAQDVSFLVRSLGGITTIRERKYKENDAHEYNGHIIRHVHSSHVVEISMPVNPFKLSRKFSRYENSKKPKLTKLFESIEYIGEDYCQCIEVDSKDHLYLVNDFILTHNTFHDSVCILDEAQNASEDQLKMYLTRLGEDSKIIITGDIEQSDLRGDDRHALARVVDNMKVVPGIGVIEFSDENIVRHPLVAAILKAWPSK